MRASLLLGCLLITTSCRQATPLAGHYEAEILYTGDQAKALGAKATKKYFDGAPLEIHPDGTYTFAYGNVAGSVSTKGNVVTVTPSSVNELPMSEADAELKRRMAAGPIGSFADHLRSAILRPQQFRLSEDKKALISYLEDDVKFGTLIFERK